MVQGLHRRVNTFVYFNPGWQERWGGHLELWDRNMSSCAQRVLPAWNRYVVFSSTDFSYHGHPVPMQGLPKGRMRRALVLYYYTKDRPLAECRHAATCNTQHDTLWVSRPSHGAACAAANSNAEVVRSVAAGALPPEASQSLAFALRGGGSPMPSNGFGTCCRASAHGPALVASAREYLTLGGRLLDSAQVYNNSRELGQAVRESGLQRRDVWITSKVNTRPERNAVAGRQEALQAVETIVRDLGLEYVDLILIHGAWKQTATQREAVWRGLLDARARGLAKHVGVSNYVQEHIEQLVKATGEWPEVNQLPFHPWVANRTRSLVAWCKRNGIQVTAYQSLGGSSCPDWLKAYRLALKPCPANRQDAMKGAVRHVATKYGVSQAQVLLRYALDQGVAVIPGATSASHIRDNLKLDAFRLTSEDMARLESSAPPPRFNTLHNLGRTPRMSALADKLSNAGRSDYTGF